MRILQIASLPTAKQWVDRDEIMLHSCFQILKDCIEKEKVDTHCNYDTHKHFVDEARFLYKWWKKRVKLKKMVCDQHVEDNAMLLRLMKIRLMLWT
jgi:hypothetical protein